MLGGRSGNRGRCAQPCRLPYCVGNKKDTYILSLKDMCGIKDLQKLKESGVYSLKIEGRMKQAGYASGVVAYYRRYIDSMKEVSDKDYKNISRLGNRCGFTDKYYFEHNGTDMVTFEKPNFVSDASDELPQFSKIKIQGKLTLKEAEPGALTVSCGGYEFTSYIDPVSHALKAPAERKNVAERISKTGDTPFEFENIDITMDNDIFVPNGALNKLRREAIEGLQNEILAQYRRTVSESYGRENKKTSEIKTSGDSKVIASVRDGKQLYRLLEYDNISEIYIGMHSMMTDDIITGKASIKGREDVENVVCSLNRIKAIRGKYSAEELSGEPPQAMITCYDENGNEIYTVKFYDGFMMVDNELYRITGKVYKELAELCDKYGECQIN